MNMRLQMPAALPADRAEVLSDIADTMRVEPSDQDLADAKLELVEEIVAGRRRGGFDLEACLESELNRDETGQTFLRELTAAIGGCYNDVSCAEYRLRVAGYLERVVGKYVSDETVRDRAEAA